ncbi:MFS transporter [Lacisediminihabitans profunda]|uniref:MFS transporter n=1 Tax=Lacisediminihabitans profunda TaxID=2594790 RepID=A0A5C8UQG3_9MICO|nr:MFS transporter [Lacisediminihabitans profunda]TXN29699.1 MFS transporter [Lacisediminihabitans profunda]
MTSIKQYSSAREKTTGRLLLLAAGTFVVGTGGFVIAGLLPGIALSLRVPETSASLLITIYALVFAIGTPIISMLTGRVSRTTLMVAGLGLVTVGNILTAVLPTFELAMVARVITGIGAAAFVPAATASAAAIAAPGRKGRAISLVTAGFTAATALGAPIGTAIGALGGWQTALWFVVALGALVVVGTGLLLRRIPLPAAQTIRERFAPLANGRIAITLLTTLLIVAGQYSGYTFFGSVQDRATGGSGTVLALLLFVYGLFATIGNLLAGSLADRLGNRVVLNVAVVVLLVDFLAMPLADGSLWSASILIAVWGLSAWAALLAVQHRVVEIAPGAIAWNSSATFFGIALSGPLGGLAISTAGAHNLTLVAAVVVVLALVVGEVSHRLVVRQARRAAESPAEVDGARPLLAA